MSKLLLQKSSNQEQLRIPQHCGNLKRMLSNWNVCCVTKTLWDRDLRQKHSTELWGSSSDKSSLVIFCCHWFYPLQIKNSLYNVWEGALVNTASFALFYHIFIYSSGRQLSSGGDSNPSTELSIEDLAQGPNSDFLSVQGFGLNLALRSQPELLSQHGWWYTSECVRIRVAMQYHYLYLFLYQYSDLKPVWALPKLEACCFFVFAFFYEIQTLPLCSWKH